MWMKLRKKFILDACEQTHETKPLVAGTGVEQNKTRKHVSVKRLLALSPAWAINHLSSILSFESRMEISVQS